MTRRQLFVLPVFAAALSKADSITDPLSVPTPTPAYATIHLGKFQNGTGPFIRRLIRIPGPWLNAHQIGVIAVTCDLRESESVHAFRLHHDALLRDITDYYYRNHHYKFRALA